MKWFRKNQSKKGGIKEKSSGIPYEDRYRQAMKKINDLFDEIKDADPKQFEEKIVNHEKFILDDPENNEKGENEND